MQGIRINRNLLKLTYKLEQGSIEPYRLYVIARAHFYKRAGIFSLDELCDVLHLYYGYKSLHKRPGNKRAKYRARFTEILGASFLFRQAPDGRFILNSERKLLNKHRGTTKSSWYELPSPEVLASKQAFSDFCIGSMLAGNKFRANKNIAGYCSCTVRRIQFATARNHSNDTFSKQFNFIHDISGSYKAVERTRAELLNIHGITSPLPVRYKDEWVLRLNAPNSYRSLVMSGVKGYAARPTVRRKDRSECWFQPIRQNFRQLDLFKKDSFKKWVFKTGVYSINDYIRDNSLMLNTA